MMDGPASSPQRDAAALAVDPHSKTRALGAGGEGRQTVVPGLFTPKRRSDEISQRSHCWGVKLDKHQK